MNKKPRSKAIYVAVTTIHENSGWWVLAAGHDKQAVEDAAYRIINSTQHGIYAETEKVNLIISTASKSKAWKSDRLSENRYEWIS